MGVDYQKCDMCMECYDDCGDNYPIEVLGTSKHVCPYCLEEYWEKRGREIKKVSDGYGGTAEEYWDLENYGVKPEWNPFPDDAAVVIETFNTFIKKWCGDHYPHLIDTDENDGEAFRKLLRKHL